MQYTNGEIVRSYKQNPTRGQIQVLSELNQCSQETIRRILYEADALKKPGPKTKKKTKSAFEPAQGPGFTKEDNIVKKIDQNAPKEQKMIVGTPYEQLLIKENKQEEPKKPKNQKEVIPEFVLAACRYKMRSMEFKLLWMPEGQEKIEKEIELLRGFLKEHEVQ